MNSKRRVDRAEFGGKEAGTENAPRFILFLAFLKVIMMPESAIKISRFFNLATSPILPQQQYARKIRSDASLEAKFWAMSLMSSQAAGTALFLEPWSARL